MMRVPSADVKQMANLVIDRCVEKRTGGFMTYGTKNTVAGSFTAIFGKYLIRRIVYFFLAFMSLLILLWPHQLIIVD